MTGTYHRAEKAYWIVAADESRAIFYKREKRRAPLQEFLSLENEVGRKKAGELLADRGGRSFDSFGTGRHTMGIEKDDPKRHAAIAFAKQIAERIGKATHDGRCRDYALIAAPRFLGLLRDEISRKCKAVPFKTVDKDVVGQDPVVLQKLIDQD